MIVRLYYSYYRYFISFDLRDISVAPGEGREGCGYLADSIFLVLTSSVKSQFSVRARLRTWRTICVEKGSIIQADFRSRMISFVFEAISLGVGTAISSGAVIEWVAVCDFIIAGLLEEVFHCEGLEDQRGSEQVGEVKLHGLDAYRSRRGILIASSASPATSLALW